jgi:hypothetical protein
VALRTGIMLAVCGIVVGAAWYASTPAQPKPTPPTNKPATKASGQSPFSFAFGLTENSDGEKKPEARREERPAVIGDKKENQEPKKDKKGKKDRKRQWEKEPRKEQGRRREGREFWRREGREIEGR